MPVHVTTNNAQSTQGQVNLLLGDTHGTKSNEEVSQASVETLTPIYKKADLVDARDAPTEKVRPAEAREVT